MRRSFACLVCIILLSTGGLGLEAQATEAQALGWSEADRAAAAYALKRAGQERTVTIDLSDPQMARFLKRHYEISGMTAARYPGLHKLMATQAKVHAAVGVTGARVTAVSDDLTYEDLATLMVALYPTAATTYAAAGVASMEASAQDPSRNLQLSYASLCFYDANSNPIGTCATQSSFGAGQYFPVNNSLSAAPQSFSGVVTATYYDVTDQRYVAQMSKLAVDAIDYPSTQTIAHPVIVHASNNSLGAALVCTSRAVNANANPGTCDYGTYQNTGVLMNMVGSVTYGPNQIPQTDGGGHLVGTGSVSLINTIQGGQCRLAPSISGTNFFTQPQVTYATATKTVSWNFNNLDFGQTASLICGGAGTGIQFSLLLQVTDTSDSDNIVAAQLSTAGVTTPHFIGANSGTLATPMLRLVAGCLHPDTVVTMASDGAGRKIASLAGEGELLKAKDGQSRVVGTVTGKDDWLYVITAKNRLSVKATAEHPFVGIDGDWRAAADLKPGDRVLAAGGPVVIASVRKIAYGGPVANLVLAHPQQGATLQTETFYANGFLVGGYDAQQAVALARRKTPAFVRSRLPGDFKVDYASHLQDARGR
ncbi:Hint domain-containing protein [Phenylobacterium sp.]|uniref:Hint domain-containing protein n=1 Tax=Phenylobacterium sp. TaxID=1871053 RepID=UPI00273269EA|nr:Hint domain-containing protein [Phenylobacterium sp.]